MAQQYAYYQTPASPSSPTSAQRLYDVDNEQSTYEDWSVPSSSAPDVPTVAQSMVWSSHNPHGLSLDLMATPTQGMFDSQYPTPVSSHLPSTWGAANGMPLAPNLCPEYTPHQVSMEECYGLDPPLPTVSSSWIPSVQEPPPYNGVYNSPGQSEYSTSSRQSFVESDPYAQSNGSQQLQSPAFIKVEDAPDSHPLWSLPGTSSLNQPAHVSLGDVYTSPSVSASDQASNTPTNFSPKDEEDEEDAKPLALRQRPRMRRCTSDHSSVYAVDDRPKRGFTTHANSTCHCKKCGKPFQRSYNLRAHMETHNPDRAQPHVCHHRGCRRRFVRRTDLIRHERSVHLKERQFACPQCHNAFARKDTLRRHVDDGCPRRADYRKQRTDQTQAEEDAKSVSDGEEDAESVSDEEEDDAPTQAKAGSQCRRTER